MKIAYLINQYPKVSHSFIRREILALESLGVTIKRFSVRSLFSELQDKTDIDEWQKTKFILGVGIVGLLFHSLKWLVVSPRRFFSALVVALKIGYHSERGVLRHLAYLAEACVLASWLRGEEIKHIHAHFGTNSTAVAMLTSIVSDVTYSFTVHGPEEFDKPKAISLAEKIKRATFVVAISSYGRSQLYRWCDYSQWGKIHVIHCGLDNFFLEADHQKRGEIQKENRLVCVGRLCPQKGQLLLVEAIRRLKDKGIDCQLTLVGDGELRQTIMELAKSLGVDSQIRITGWLSSDGVKREISQAKLMVMPSFAEGLPVAIMESLALGIPVITTYVAGIPELVVDGESGWLVTPGDIDALTETLIKALNTPVEVLQQMGRKGRERVIQNHSANREARKLLSLFCHYLGGDED
ncbi:MAG: glycosyltransferase family 4 protein [Geminocystis sp.]|nr:glycosyltransferase family 4 protein [Geminocystis sp.]HIK37391.1 glycosyltransferase family 4 protein [Geminocystis sp. M7585_C2015_104]MCS7147432.1 glycosyltransferase family 4 protein [Geminocystis sp.]MCX8079331.1 glycosyltransferase family 4 protein [Geminocystis sp.]MDW8117165.1 glycosyltransferase family 4 protein [Geminocystis sp.]